MKTFGMKQRRQSFPPRVQVRRDPVEEVDELLPISEYIDKLIDESPEVMRSPSHLSSVSRKEEKWEEYSEPGMIFIPLPSQVSESERGSSVLSPILSEEEEVKEEEEEQEEEEEEQEEEEEEAVLSPAERFPIKISATTTLQQKRESLLVKRSLPLQELSASAANIPRQRSSAKRSQKASSDALVNLQPLSETETMMEEHKEDEVDSADKRFIEEEEEEEVLPPAERFPMKISATTTLQQKRDSLLTKRSLPLQELSASAANVPRQKRSTLKRRQKASSDTLVNLQPFNAIETLDERKKDEKDRAGKTLTSLHSTVSPSADVLFDDEVISFRKRKVEYLTKRKTKK